MPGGEVVSEIVRDPAVIQSYMKRVEAKKIDEYMKNPESLRPTGDPVEDAMQKQA